MKKALIGIVIGVSLLFAGCKATTTNVLEASLGTLQIVAQVDGAGLGLSNQQVTQVVTVTNGVEKIVQAGGTGWVTQANLAFATLESPGLFSGVLDTYIEGVQVAFNALYQAGVL